MERKTYSEMINLKTFGDRLDYLRLRGGTHESPRSISNKFYKSRAWRQCREDIIKRDLGRDLSSGDMFIKGRMLVHHINPLTEEDIENWSPNLFDPENLVTVSEDTHNLIHYSKRDINVYTERVPGDTKLW